MNDGQGVRQTSNGSILTADYQALVSWVLGRTQNPGILFTESSELTTLITVQIYFPILPTNCQIFRRVSNPVHAHRNKSKIAILSALDANRAFNRFLCNGEPVHQGSTRLQYLFTG
ncbi:unnamed protein product [Taenia asiatica]|uniref:Uncharacterized protein n=1 Tax=Taenia asiatica TaxID=60517 RepID=A0A0R3W3G2_TAEAS|nr:unnamed protein product [Taenia asiatica]